MSPIEAQFQRWGPAYRWIATVTVMTGTIATTATATIVNVALPDIMGAFSLGADEAQWLSTGFLAAMTATMLVTAWAIERLGQRLAFCAALVVFVAGCVAGALAESGGAVILARVMQGAASGLIQPQAMIVISQVFPREQRGTAMGVYGMGVVLAPALGPTAGGILVDEYSWRDVFLVVIPFCAASFAAAAVFLPRRPPDAAPPKGFDWGGFTLLVVFLTVLLTGLSNGQRWGWASDSVLGLFVLAGLAGVAFIGCEVWSDRPMVAIRVFTVGRFCAAALVAFALGAGIYASTYIVPLFVEAVQGYTPTRSGMLLMPAGLVLAIVFPIAGRLSDKLPPHIPIMAGLAVFGFSCWLSAGVDIDTSFGTLAFWVLLGRIGLGLMLPALNAGALRALPTEMLAQGSGSINFVRQLGGAFGVNLLSVLVERRTTFHSDALAQALTPESPSVADTLQRLGLLLTHWGNPFGNRLPSEIPPAALSYFVTVIVPKARLLAYQDGFLIVAIVFFLAILPAWFMGRAAKRA